MSTKRPPFHKDWTHLLQAQHTYITSFSLVLQGWQMGWPDHLSGWYSQPSLFSVVEVNTGKIYTYFPPWAAGFFSKRDPGERPASSSDPLRVATILLTSILIYSLCFRRISSIGVQLLSPICIWSSGYDTVLELKLWFCVVAWRLCLLLFLEPFLQVFAVHI